MSLNRRRRRIGLIKNQCDGLVDITSVESLVKPPICVGAAGPPIPADWFDTNYLCRVAITIQASQVFPPLGQTDFPFLFNSVVEAFKTVPLTNGADFRFVLLNKQEIPFEIQNYDRPNGRLIAWTKLKVFDGLKFYVYYNNPAPASPPQFPTTDVWSDYEAVYHMDVNVSGGAFVDSTTNHDGTGSITSDTVGKIGRARQFNGSSDRINTGNFNIGGAGNNKLTMQAWIKTDDIGNFRAIYGKSVTGGPGTSPFLFWSLFQLGTEAQIRVSGDTVDDNGLNATDFFKIDGTYNGVRLELFINAVSKGTQIRFADIENGNQNVLIGARDTTTVGEFFEGKIDEVRLLTIARSGDFIQTEFNNQNTPEAFYNLVAPECLDDFYLLENGDTYTLENDDDYLIAKGV